MILQSKRTFGQQVADALRERARIEDGGKDLWKPLATQDPRIVHPQQLAYDSLADELYYGGSAGGGKGLDLDTPLPTPDGFVLMRDIQAGDEVLSDDGPCRVVAVSPVQERRTFRVVFDDRAELIADDVHRWSVSDYFQRIYATKKLWARASTRIVSTLDLADNLRIGREERLNYSVELIRPIDFERRDLLIDPYTLGLWLGDGNSASSLIGLMRGDWNEILNHVPYSIVSSTEDPRYKSPFDIVRFEGLQARLTALGLKKNKRIPEIYRRASAEQRLELIRGIMDTDGACNSIGYNELGLSKEDLFDDVREVLCTLGLKVGKIHHPSTNSWRMKFISPYPLFKLRRKLMCQKLEGFRPTTWRRYVERVEEIEPRPAKCIVVNSPSRTYLAGRQMVTTHNTDLALGLAVREHRATVFFRREFAQLRGPEGAWARACEIIGDYGTPNKALFVIAGLPGGRSIEFAGMQHEDDKNKWKGRPHDLYVFDEIPEFLESQYRFVIAWNRTTRVGQRTRVVCTGNPPTTPEGRWVINYWGPWLDRHHKNPASPGELRWFAVVDGEDVAVDDGTPFKHKGEIIKPLSRTFIPASVRDNPHLMATDYPARLQNLPEPLRSQLLYGDFSIVQTDNPWQLFPTAWVEAAQARWTSTRPNVPMSQLGCDPSRGGKDETVNAKRYGEWIAPLDIQPGKEMPDGPHVARFVIVSIGNNHKVPIGMDVGGIGSSPYDFLKTAGMNVVALNGSEKSVATDKSGKLHFANKRAEWGWNLREMLDPSSAFQIAFPPDTQMAADLFAMRWRLTPRGIQLSDKEEIKERIGRSPDRGEAVIYAFADLPRKPMNIF